MKFARTYSEPGDPYAGISFEPRTSRIANPDGKVVFEAKDVQIPSAWSQVAADILALELVVQRHQHPRPEVLPPRRRPDGDRSGPRGRDPGVAVAFRAGVRRLVHRGDRRPPGLPPAGRLLDLLGVQARLFRRRVPRAGLL